MDAAASRWTRSTSVLADPTRTAILQLMLNADGGRVLVGETADTLHLRQPTVSHHMKWLFAEGVVTRQPDGRRTWYAIAASHRERIAALLILARGPERIAADLDRVVDHLVIRFGGSYSRDAVAARVDDARALLRASTPARLLTSRAAAFAAERMEAALPMPMQHGATRPPTVLFVCVHNAGRSQIAASVLRRIAGHRVRVHTAGSLPSDEVRASIVGVLDEIGLSLDGEYPKPLTDEIASAADFVVTMGCGEVCVRRNGATHLEWDIADPVGLPAAELRRVRDDISHRVRNLLPHLIADQDTVRSSDVVV